ncbi:MAG: hypothetical protein KDJ52_19810 [Anaerolineae bacterium]|nr:hypothetical protein [Anaerolineae bacterium]
MYEQDEWKKVEMHLRDMEFIRNNHNPNPLAISFNIIGFLIGRIGLVIKLLSWPIKLILRLISR